MASRIARVEWLCSTSIFAHSAFTAGLKMSQDEPIVSEYISRTFTNMVRPLRKVCQKTNETPDAKIKLYSKYKNYLTPGYAKRDLA